jgi:single-strand DNA-binding protein
MAGVNKVIVVGNLGRDPELKETSGGSQVCRLNVATTRTWKHRETGEKMEETEWHRISVWGKQAPTCAQYLAKGRQVYVEGRLRTSSYRKDGEETDRYTTEIVADDVQFLGGKEGSGSRQQERPSSGGGGDDDEVDF